MTTVFATTYIIDNYNFIFEDKTDLNIVYSRLGLEDYTTFESYEELVEYVKEKEQEIANWNIFNSTESFVLENETIIGSVLNGEKHYTAVFEINDKNPLFIFPTPKYDSNTGLSLGIKMDSKNLSGKLASFTTKFLMEQKNNSFETADYSINFNLTELPVAGFKMDTSLSFIYDASQKGILKGSSLVFDANLYDIKLGDTVTFKFKTGSKFNPTKNEIQSFGVEKFYYSATIANLFMQQGGFDLTQGINYYPRKNLVETNFKLSYFGFKLQNRTITLSVDITITNLNRKTDSNTSSSLDNKTSQTDNTGIASSAVFYDSSVSDTISPDAEGGGIISLIKKELIAIPFILPLDFNITPSLMLISTYETNGHEEMKDWTVVKEVAVATTISRSAIDKVIKGNQDFRKGISFSLSAVRKMYINDLLDESSQYATLSLSYFPFATSWINPSIRFTGIISKIQTKSLFDVDSNPDCLKMADYMRGIRNDNKYNIESWNSILAANINITTRCINLGSWARTYAIPFVDIAYLAKTDTESSEEITGSHWLCAVGIEGIGIINDHSNYPVRASLGFNSASLKTFFQTKDFDDLEYELFFGLGFFY